MTTSPRPASTAMISMFVSLVVIPINVGVAWLILDSPHEESEKWLALFLGLAGLQFITGIAAIVLGARERKRDGSGGLAPIVVGAMTTLGAPLGSFLAVIGSAMTSFGGAWGRPLRIRGKQLHPNLTIGSDWTQGERPSPEGLSEADRSALEALWLHDAQKEHASVPAFSRVSWLLAAVGAPAELLAWSHRAAIEEIDHTQRCFALAAGYAGRSHTVEPMPDLLVGGLDLTADPLVTLAVESLEDGCQLEDFNADVAAACARVCETPETKRVLEQIAKEERSHADLSWAILEWVLVRDRARVGPAVAKSVQSLERVRRPTAVSFEKRALVAAANEATLRRHGRLTDAEWAACWAERLVVTRARVAELFARHAPPVGNIASEDSAAAHG